MQSALPATQAGAVHSARASPYFSSGATTHAALATIRSTTRCSGHSGYQCNTSPPPSQRCLALAATVTILLAIIAAPLLTFAAPPAPAANGAANNSNRANSPQATYPLQGDAVNPTGSGFTSFNTNHGDPICAWCFYSFDTTLNGAVTLQAYGSTNAGKTAYGPNNVAARFRASGVGVVGIQETTPASLNPTLPAAGVAGYATSGIGVDGNSSSNDGVYGQSAGSGYAGVWGLNTNSGPGVYGSSTSGYGVSGKGVEQPGVYGSSITQTGVSGVSTNGTGISGSSTSGRGVEGISNASNGVYGITYGRVSAVLGDSVSGGHGPGHYRRYRGL